MPIISLYRRGQSYELYLRDPISIYNPESRLLFKASKRLRNSITLFYYVKALYSIKHFHVRITTTLIFFNLLLLLKLKMSCTRPQIDDEFPEDSEQSIVLATNNEVVMSDNPPLPTLNPYASLRVLREFVVDSCACEAHLEFQQ